MFLHFSVHFTKLDVTVKEDWVKAWDEAEELLGGKIEILCNNAGVPPRVSDDNEMGFKITILKICRPEWTSTFLSWPLEPQWE